MAASSLWLLQLPSPPPPPPPPHGAVFLSTNHCPSPPSASASPLLHRKHAPARAKGNLACSSSGSSSSSTSSVVTKDQEGAAAAAPTPAAVRYDYKDDPNFRGCKGCGREEPERGCNGEGRIMGGIAAVPLFGWWPIKAYRPCPGFVASGGRYRRYGQSMDDVIAGKGRKLASEKKKSDK
ncbi:uncharacterized protein LOC123443284 [Hordeum vulgare subsp. vulgare]|uniref:Uncharacterized protein n=1 Tax=Hordeum vulgare subsp. vulgare TaxID=112509 RepID=M0V1S6_HORVV|nr:uncharacterized protein LOC123443284 [Hordeum vulgare subsp. vulgare]